MSDLERRAGVLPRARFDYTFAGDPNTTTPELRSRTGQTVTVLGPVSIDEYDWEEFFPDALYEVLFDDGLTHQAWLSELHVEDETSQLGTERSER